MVRHIIVITMRSVVTYLTALSVAFGSMYKDEVELYATSVIPVTGAACLFQMVRKTDAVEAVCVMFIHFRKVYFNNA
jgi:hypothetical protein